MKNYASLASLRERFPNNPMYTEAGLRLMYTEEELNQRADKLLAALDDLLYVAAMKKKTLENRRKPYSPELHAETLRDLEESLARLARYDS